MPQANASVACNHDPRLLVKRSNVLFDHGLPNDAGFRAGGITFADDADVHLDRRNAALFGKILYRVGLIGSVRRKFIDRDVTGPTDVGQSFGDALRILVLLIWHKDFDGRSPSIVGIAIREKIETALARRFDHADVLRRLAPNADGAELDVRMLDGDVGALADSDLFLQGLKREVSFVADVRHVKAMELGRGGCESDDF